MFPIALGHGKRCGDITIMAAGHSENAKTMACIILRHPKYVRAFAYIGLRHFAQVASVGNETDEGARHGCGQCPLCRWQNGSILAFEARTSAMLQNLRIQHYRCLRDVTLELGAFTVFVGPNASGKTAIADALTADSVVTLKDHWRHDPKAFPIWIVAQSDSPKGMFKDPSMLKHAGLGLTRKFVFHPDKLRTADTADEVWQLSNSGDNLANFFATLSRPDQERFVKDFIELLPEYADIKARAQRGNQRLQFQDRWDDAVWYETQQVSDGTMLAAAFVALGYQRDAPQLAVFEDPDRGLHPYLQRRVVELLRALSSGEIGPKPIQIVCTTHSKALLDYLRPEEVRFLARKRDTGETVVKSAPTDNERWQDVYDTYQQSLGNMWLTGALGGVPGV